jgi:hypothetical protein
MIAVWQIATAAAIDTVKDEHWLIVRAAGLAKFTAISAVRVVPTVLARSLQSLVHPLFKHGGDDEQA